MHRCFKKPVVTKEHLVVTQVPLLIYSSSWMQLDCPYVLVHLASEHC